MHPTLRDLRTKAGLTQDELAEKVGATKQQVSMWETGSRNISARWLLPLANALGTTVEALLAIGSATVVQEILDEPQLPLNELRRVKVREQRPTGAMTRDLPILGTTQGGDGDADFMMNGEVVDWSRRPDSLLGVRDAFGLYLEGDSMSDRFERGELLIFHPGRKPLPGNFVVVELHPEERGEPAPSLFKRLVALTPTEVVLEQFNPPKTFSVPRKKVIRVVRMMTTAELLGM